MKSANTQFYTNMYIETLERLSTRVAQGESTPRNTAEQILELTNATNVTQMPYLHLAKARKLRAN